MKKLLLIIALLQTFILFSNLSLIKKNGKIIFSGYTKLVGSEPFTRVVIENDKKETAFLPDSFKIEHKNYLYKKITIQGVLKKRELMSADKKYKVIEYYFDDYVILN